MTIIVAIGVMIIISNNKKKMVEGGEGCLGRLQQIPEGEEDQTVQLAQVDK